VRLSFYVAPVKKQLAKTLLLLLVGGISALVGIFGIKPAPASAATSNYLNFQSRLLTNTGSVVADGNYNIEFKIYNASSSSGSSQGSCSGDSNCLWTETRTSANQVRVVNGYLSVNLGSVTALSAITNWDQQLYLTMNIGGSGSPSWDGEMNPRITLTSIPYAFQANKANQLYTTSGANSGSLTFAGVTNNPNLLLPDVASGTVLVSTTGVQLQGSTPGTQQTGNLNISGTGIFGSNVNTSEVDTNYLNFGNENLAAIQKWTSVGSTGVSPDQLVIVANESGSLKAITTTTPRDQRIFGIAQGNASSGGGVYVTVSGTASVQVDTAAVSIGDQLVASSTAGRATVDNSATTGILGIARQAKAGGSNGLVLVELRVVGGQYSPTFRNAANSTTAFQIQNAAGASLLTADTSNMKIEVNGDLYAKGLSWTARTAAQNNIWNGVTYGNGLFVAVSSDGTNQIMTSPDGANWSTRTAAAANTWRSITYGNGLFVAVSDSGTGNRVMTSPDGVNWTVRDTTGKDNNWESVTYGNGLFVAVANTGTNTRVMTSPDGVNWTIRDTTSKNFSWQSVTYGNSLFVAVSSGDGGSTQVMTSPDGITWTIRTSAGSANSGWTGVTYGNGTFVAVSSNNTNRVMTSPDGTNWTARNAAVANSWQSVTYGNGLFVSVSTSGTGNRVMTSTDGTNWNIRTSAADSDWASVIYANGMFVAVGDATSGSNRVMTSGHLEQTLSSNNNTFQGGATIYGNSLFKSDLNSTTAFQIQNSAGSTLLNVDTTNSRIEVMGDVYAKGLAWTSRTNPVDNNWISVAYGNGLFAAVSQDGTNNQIMTSPDSVNWTVRTTPGSTVWQAITYGNGLFVAVADSATMTSPDGITWTSRTPAANVSWDSVTYGNGKFVAVSNTGTGNRVMSSPDGVNWTIRSNPVDNDWKSVTFGNGIFVAVAQTGTSNRVMTSPDGTTWTTRTSSADDNWQAVTYGNGLFVAVGNQSTTGSVMTSPDGTNWTNRSQSINSSWKNVTYGNGLFVAVTTGGTTRVMTSTDGINWTARTAAAANNWAGIAYGNGVFTAVSITGTNNRVMTSGKAELNTAPINNIYQGGVTVYGGSTFSSGTDSTSSFQIQNSTGTSIFTADTLNNQITQSRSIFTGNILPSIAGTVASTTTSVSAIESALGTGAYTTTAVGVDGLPVVAYYAIADKTSASDADGSSLKFAHCSNSACSSSTTTTVATNLGTLDSSATASTVTPADIQISMKIGYDGLPIISYYNCAALVGVCGGVSTSDHVIVTHCGNITCTSGNVTTTLDSGSRDTGYYSSLTIGRDGNPFVAYYDNSTNDLRSIHCTNVTCSTSDASQQLVTTGDAGNEPSVTIGTDGFPIIASWKSDSVNALITLHCTAVNCSTSDSAVTIDNNGGSNVAGRGAYPGIAIGSDGMPIIAYDKANGTGNGQFFVAHCSVVNCSSSSIVQPAGLVANDEHYTKLAIGADGMPIIVSAQSVNLDPMFYHCTTITCSTVTSADSPETSGDIGKWGSVTIGADGLPIYAYYKNDGTNGLRIARCGSVTNCGAASAGIALGGGINLGAAGSGLQNAYVNNINTSDAINPLNFNVNGSTRVSINPNGTTTFTGYTLFKPFAGADSTTAFQIQSAGGTDTLFTTDTTNNKLVVGNSTGTNASTTLLVLDNATADPTTGYAGAMYYNPSLGKFRCYTTVWGDCASAGGGSGDNITVNGSAAADANFINVSATGTVTGTTWTLNTGTTPNQISLNVSNASTSQAGSVTTGTQSFAGDKTFQSTTNSATAFQIQNASSSSLLSVDTTTSNLVTNPSFEVDVSTGWADASSGTGLARTRTTTAANVYHGVAAQQVITASSAANTGASLTGFTSSITPGTYTLSFDARASVSFSTFDVTITGGGAPTCLSGQTLTTGFQRFTCTFTSTSTNVTAINFVTTTSTQQTFYIDAVQLLSGSSSNPYTPGKIQLNSVVSGPVSFQNSSNSSTAFQIQDASGSSLLIADTTNSKIQTGNLEAITPGAASYNNALSVVDSTGGGLEYSPIAMGSDGYARISYFDGTNSNNDLKFAQCTNADCSTKNITTVDSTGDVGHYSGLAMGSDGYARISYYDFTNSDLKFAQCTNADCSTKNITTVDSTGSTGLYTSLAIGSDGFARISYVGGTNFKFVQCTNADCSTKNITTLTTSSGGSLNTSIAMGSDGFARIALGLGSVNIRFVQCTNADCSTNNNNIVSSTATSNPSIAMGSDGFARISYTDQNSGGVLKFIQCTNADCTSRNTNTVDSSTINTGFYPSLRMGSDGFARISYQDLSTTVLKFAQCTNASCSSSNRTTIDSTASVGYFTSIAIGSDGFARITYIDGTHGTLKFARLGGTTGVAGITGSSIGSSTVSYGQLYVKGIHTDSFSLVDSTGAALFKNGQDSATAFQIQNASGSQLLNVDTSTTPNVLAINPDFEATSVSSWVGKLGTETIARTTSTAYQGNASLSVTEPGSAAANSGVKSTQSINLSGNTTYALSAYVKTQTGTISTFEIGRSENNGSTDTSCSTNQTVSSTGWTRLTCTFTTGDVVTSPYIYIRDTAGNTSAVWYVDGVQLEAKTNLLTNPGVESAIGAEWAAANASNNTVARSTTAGHFNSGVAGLDVNVTGAGGTNMGAKAVVSLSSYTTYTFSVYAKNVSGSVSTMEIGRSENGSTFTSCSTGLTITTSFTQFNCTFTTGATSGSTFVYIRDTASRSAASPSFYVDSAQLFAGTNTAATAFQNGTIALNGVINSPTSFRNQADSTTAFQVQNSSGVNLLSADTTNMKIEVNGGIYSKGIKWTSRTLPSTGQTWWSVAYGNGRFVSVASNGGSRIMASTDGINWMTPTDPNGGGSGWRAVTYGNGLFVAVATSGTNRVMTSPDGINWTVRDAAAANQWTSVTYGNGLFVAVSIDGANQVMTSPDGINWNSRSAASSNSWESVTYGNGRFVAVTDSGANKVMYSLDGITWSSSASAINANQWWGVTYGNGLFVAVGITGSGNRVMTSVDGSTWTSRNSAADNNWRNVTYGNGLFVAISDSGVTNSVMTSPDGINWTTRTASAANSWVGITYANGTFVVTGNSAGSDGVMTSGQPEMTVASNNNIYQGGETVYGNSLFKSDVNSSTAFQVQNTSGTSLFTVDTTNSQILLPGSSLIQSPLSPVYKGGASTAPDLNGVATSGNYTYITANGNGGTCNSTTSTGCELQVYDTSNPASPAYKGGADAGTGASTDAFNNQVVSGKYVYIVKSSNNGTCSSSVRTGCELQIYDVSNPTNPTYVGGADSINAGTGTDTMFGVTVAGKYAYIAKAVDGATCSSTTRDGCELQAYDISNPANPVYVGGADTGGTNLGYVQVYGRYLYAARAGNPGTCSSGNNAGCEFQIFDISNPATPTYVGGADDNAASGGDDARSVFVSGRYAYITKAGYNGTCSSVTRDGCELQIYDISDPTAPVYKGGADSINAGNGSDGFWLSAVVGKYAYVAKVGNAGTCSATDRTGCELQVYDVSDPTAPVYKGGVDNGGTTDISYQVAIGGHYAYLAKVGNGGTCSSSVNTGCEFQIYDISGIEATAISSGSIYAGTLQVQDSAIFENGISVSGNANFSQNAEISGNLGVNGAATFQNSANSTTAFQIQNASSSQLFNVDTSTTPNLLTSNPDFENSSVTSWVGKLGTETVARTTSTSWQGNAALSVTEPASAAANSGVKYVQALSATTTYALSAYVKTQTGTISTFEIGRAENGSSDTSCSTGQTVTSTGWTRLTCTFTTGDTAPSSSYIYIRDTTGNVSKVWYVDGVQLEAKTNLLTNPGVETALSSDWAGLTSTTAARSTTAGHFNSGAAGLDVTPSVTGTNRGVKNPVALSSYTTYTLSMYIKDPNTSQVTMEMGRSEDNGSTFTPCTTHQTITTSFVQLSCNFTTGVTSGTTFIYIRDSNTRANTAPFYVDTARLFVGTNTAPSAFQNGTIALNGVVNSPTSFRNQVDSTVAFQIQNASGASLLSVDSINSNVTLLGNNSGEVQPWKATNDDAAVHAYHQTAIINGYFYEFDSSVTSKAKVNADGTLGTFSSTTTDGYNRDSFGIATANGYVYLVGGSTGSAVANVTYAKPNADGSISSWQNATSLPAARMFGSVFIANGYLYALGGTNAGGQTTSYYAKLNTDGSIGSWNTTTVLPSAMYGMGTAVANGYVYLTGGNGATNVTPNVYYAKLNTDGSIGSWTTVSNALPGERYNHSSAVINGYLYVVGGLDTTPSGQTSVYYAQLNNNGSVGAFTTAVNSLPAARSSYGALVTANGYMYVAGGNLTTSSAQSSIYYTSTSRLQIGGGLDLVGISGENLNEGGSGGTLTAGNTIIVGSLNVQGLSTFQQALSVNDNLTVAGDVLLNSANTGAIQQWQTGNNSGFTGEESYASVIANGYIYIIGGVNGGGSLSTVQYAKLGANGNPVGTWTTTSALPAVRDNASATYASNGYIYLTGGSNNNVPGSGQSSVYYAKVNSDGTLGSWITSANPISVAGATIRSQHTSVAYNGYLYVIGGSDGSSFKDYVHYSKLNPDGSNGPWTATNTLSIPAGRHTSVVANGYLYVIGADSTNGKAVQYAKLNTDGTTGTWSTTTALPGARYGAGVAVENGYVYLYGGDDNVITARYKNTYFAPLNSDGTVGTWSCQGNATDCTGTTPVNSTDIPAASGGYSNTIMSKNGYIYAIGGYSGSHQSTVYYASTARTQINGSLDLVGANGENLSEGGTGGELTAGNTNIVGSLNIQGISTFQRALSVNDSLTVAGDVALNSGNIGAVQPWQTATGTGFSGRQAHDTVIANGYIYTIAGVASGPTVTGTVQYAKLSANGNVGNWNTTTSLPGNRSEASATYANGYIYVTGGSSADTSATVTNTVYYAKVNNDGTLGSWNTSSNPLPVSIWSHKTVSYNGYLYVIDGVLSNSGVNNVVYYARLNADGSTGVWATTNVPGNSAGNGVAIANGYVYITQGLNGAGVLYAKLNADGTMNAWSSATSLPVARENVALAVNNGYLYAVAGSNTSGANYFANTYFAQLNADGSIGSWSCQGSTGDCSGATQVNTVALPNTRAYYGKLQVANGYMYVVGGINGSGIAGTVYYTSTARTQINGSLDLVGANGENLNEGGSGGSLTAGNTNIIGDLGVRGQASFLQGVSIDKSLIVNGDATIKTATNSTTAFQVQNSGGAQLLNVDTTNPVSDLTTNSTSNLVTNGSMEGGNSTTGWSAQGSSTLTQNATQRYVGNNSLSVATTAAANDGAKYALTTTTLATDTQYTLTLSAKLGTTTNSAGTPISTIEIGRAENGSSDTSCATGQTINAYGWTTLTCTFTTGATSGTPYIYIKQTDSTARTFYVDGVQLTRSWILQNYSIEQALSASNWQKKSGSETTHQQTNTQAYIGTNSLQVTTRAVANDGTKQSITLNDSTTYSLSFFVLGTATQTITLQAGYSSDGSTDDTVCITGQSTFPGTSPWTNYVCTFTTPSTHTGTPYIYIMNTAATVRTFYLDNIQLSYGNKFTAYREGTISLNGIIVSPTTYQNQTNSSTAFQIQNTSGGNLFQVDTQNSVITLNGVNSGAVQPWKTGNNSGFPGRSQHATVIANGFIYVIGGISNGSPGSAQSSVYYAKLQANGDVGNWTTTTSLPANRVEPGATFANGYMYVTGGGTTNLASNAQDTVYYVKVNQDGTLGAWSNGTAINVGGSSQKRIGHNSLAYNGYLYVAGGADTTGVSVQTVYYSKLNADGSNGAWNSTTAIGNVANGAAAIANGYMYITQGNNAQGIKYGKINLDGTISSWTAATSLPGAREDGGLNISNGYIYYFGGTGADGGQTKTTYYAPLNSDGSIGSWSCQGQANTYDCAAAPITNNVLLPIGRRWFGKTPVVANGYMYVIGGNETTNDGLSTVYFTSGARTQINGSLDLVGASGENLNEGGTGGELTAGNTNIIGDLGVRGQASFQQGVAIDKELRVGSSVLIQNNTNSSTAFQVQNASGIANIKVSTINLIANTTFEKGVNGQAPDSWTTKGTGATITNSTTFAYLGSSSMSVVTTATANAGAAYNYSLLPSTQYSFSFYARSSSGSYSITIGRQDVGSDIDTGCSPGSNTAALTTTFTRFTCTFTTGATISGTPNIYLKDTGTSHTFYVDGVQLETAAAATSYREGDIRLDSLVNIRSTADLGNTPLTIDSGTTGINLLTVKDMSANFGSAITGGAFISRNSYFGEEYNTIQNNNCTPTAATGSAINAWARGDNGNHAGATACSLTANTVPGNGEMTLTTSTAGSTTLSACSATSPGATTANGVERIAAIGAAGTGNKAICAEYLTGSTTISNKIYTATNLPVITMKVKPSTLAAANNNSFIVAGTSSADSVNAATPTSMPTAGYFFTNCSTYSATAPTGCSNTTWYGMVVASSAIVGSAQTCTGSLSTSNFAYLRIEFKTATEVHFYVDVNTADGIVETECGSGVSNASVPATAVTPWLEAANITNTTAANATLDVDYYRSWQDDNVPPPNDTVDTTPSGDQIQTEAPVVVDPNSPDPDIAGSFFNFMGATSEDMIVNGNLYVHGTIYADKIKANEIEGLTIYTDQLASLQQRLNQVTSETTNPNAATTTTNIVQSATTTINLNDGLTVGGDANFHGNAFFYKLVTFTEKTFFNNDVTFQGHITTAGQTPTADLQEAAGITVAPVDNPTAVVATSTIDGNDNSGKITINTGDSAVAGSLIKINFKKPFAKAPQVFLTPGNDASGQAHYYINSTTDGFTIVVKDAPTSGQAYTFNYLIIQ
jgi:hypothetical protein